MARRPDRAVSIVIPNHNHSHTIQACIESIFDTLKNKKLDLIVVDDGSTDNSLEILNQISGIRVIRQERGGIASALNAGFKAAGTKDVIRIHPETLVETPDWLDKLLKAAKTLPKAGIIGVKLLRPDDTIQSVGRNILTRIGFRDWYSNRQINQENRDDNLPAQEVDTVPGNLAYYRREVIETIGGLDENYFPELLEDDDFCQSARFNGFKVYVLPAVKAVNYSAIPQTDLSPFFTDTDFQINRFHFQRNNALNRHYEYWERKWGWHPLHPDLNEIRRLYGNTEICWRIGEAMRFKPQQWLPAVDACMITWNSLKSLQRALDSLAKTDYPKDLLYVYVVNNASTDGTKEYLNKLVDQFPFTLKPIHLDVNVGAPAGLNWAFVQGKGEIIAKLDDDVILPPDWLSLVHIFKTRPYAGVVGAKVINDNTLRNIQCAGTSMWPIYDDFQNYPDTGQANYLSLCSHVRGCACLYRRDVMKECGLLDIRFSPSQTDDVEHHFRIGAAGYDIVYNGKISIIHALGTGTGATRNRTTWSNVVANETKLRGKWSNDIHQILEQNIDFSREGRFLPDDGDSSQWVTFGPQPRDYPKKIPLSDNMPRLINELNQYEQKELPTFISLLQGLVFDHLAFALSLLTNYKLKIELAQNLIYEALRLMPDSSDAMLIMAVAHIENGRPAKSLPLFHRASLFLPKNSETAKTLQQILAEADDEKLNSRKDDLINIIRQNIIYGRDMPLPKDYHLPSLPLPAAPAKCTPQPRHLLKVLIVAKYGPQFPGDIEEGKFLQSYVAHLDQAGIYAEIDRTPRPNIEGFDLVHIWGMEQCEKTIQQVKAVRVAAPDIPMVLSPRYGNIVEADWASHIVPRIIATATSNEHLNGMLQQLARDQLILNGLPRSAKREPFFPGYFAYQQRIIDMADYILPQSKVELNALQKVLGVQKPLSFMQYAVELDDSKTTKDNLFIQKYGVRDFALMVGAVRAQENQIMALIALANSNIPVVVIGSSYQDETEYKRLCRKFATNNTLFIEDLPPDMQLSAFKSARIFIMPAWKETTLLPALQAALSNCALVLNDRGAGVEYFQNHAYYCDPADITSISRSIVDANLHYEAERQNREQFSQYILKTYTWDNTILQAVSAYKAALEARGRTISPELQTSVEKVKAIPTTMPTQLKIPQVDIVIPVYGQPQLLYNCVESVLKTTQSERIFLVDDCSPGDDIQNLFTQWKNHPRITLAKTPTNQGFIGATRLGATLGSAPFILFLNSDTLATEPGWLEKLIPSDNDVGITGAKLLYPPDLPGPLAGTIQHAGVARNENVIPYHPFLGFPADIPEANQVRDVNAITGACYLIRRSLWDELGGWDKQFGRGVYEDVDLCWRVRAKGYRVLYQPAVTLYHYESASKSPDGHHSLNENTQGNLQKLLAKWQGVTSDEAVFYGQEKVDNWQLARNQLRPILQLIEARQLPSGGLPEMYRIVEKAPDLPDILIAYAQLLAAKGEHEKAVNYYAQAVKHSPAYWAVRMKLIEELSLSGQPDKAAKELASLRKVFPDNAELRKYEESLAPNIEKARTAQTILQTNAEKLLDRLLDSDDLLTALKENEDRLDDNLLSLVQANAQSVRREGNLDLADGLDDLAEYIKKVITTRQSTQPIKTNLPVEKGTPGQKVRKTDRKALETLDMLLNADNLVDALKQHEDLLDSKLLDLVKTSAETNGNDGNLELAKGLDYLATYIKQIIIIRQNQPVVGKASQTLDMLLNSDDLVTALKENKVLLDQDLLDYVKFKADSAARAGDSELAEGLTDLAAYIQQVIR